MRASDRLPRVLRRSAGLLALAYIVGCGSGRPVAPPEPDGTRAFAHLQAQVAFGPRVPGSRAAERCRRYLYEELARHTPKVTGVRVERVQDITPEDCIAEGIQIPISPDGKPLLCISDRVDSHPLWKDPKNATEANYWTGYFALKWNEINAAPKPRYTRADGRRVITHYESDEENTEVKTVLLLRVGGIQERASHGIHWHVDPDNRIRYRADESREKFYEVELTTPQGTVKRYRAPDTGAEDLESGESGGEWRLMDCIDCHNRPTHVYRTPEEAIDEATQFALDSAMPLAEELEKFVYAPFKWTPEEYAQERELRQRCRDVGPGARKVRYREAIRRVASQPALSGQLHTLQLQSIGGESLEAQELCTLSDLETLRPLGHDEGLRCIPLRCVDQHPFRLICEGNHGFHSMQHVAPILLAGGRAHFARIEIEIWLQEGCCIRLPFRFDHGWYEPGFLLLRACQKEGKHVGSGRHHRQSGCHITPPQLFGSQNAGDGRSLAEAPILLGDARLEHAKLPALLDQGRRNLAAFIGFMGRLPEVFLRVALHSLNQHALLIIRFKSIHGALL